jgi:hypothetical protein
MKHLACTFTTLIAFFALFSPGARASQLDAAARAFSAEHPDARFVESENGNGFYLVYGFALETGDEDPVEAAERFLADHRGLLGLDGPQASIEHARTVAHRDQRYLRFDQLIDGLPVFGGRAIVHIDSKGRIIKVNSTAASPPARRGPAAIDSQEAISAALDHLDGVGEAVGVADGYLPLQGETVRVYRVQVSAPGPHMWVVFVDATSGSVIRMHDAIRRHLANVYAENPEVDSGTHEELLENIVADGEHAYHTYGDYIRVARCLSLNSQTGECDEWEHQALATDVDGFTGVAPFDGNNQLDDGFAEVQTYYSLDTYYKWMRDEFGFSAQFVDAESMESGQSIWIFVNANFANGFFLGSSDYYGNADMIVLGQGQRDFSYDNDVTRHEFTHAVSSQVFNNIMYNVDHLGVDMSGTAVEEGTADFFPCSVHDNPELGEYIGVSRNADNDARCPEGLMGEGHHDGMIISGTMWSIRDQVGNDKAVHLHFGTLAGNTVMDFNDYGVSLEAQAYAMQQDSDPELQITAEEFASIQDEIEARNLRLCKRVVPVEPGSQHFQYMPYSFSSDGTPSSVQYEISAGEETEVLTLTIEPFGDAYDVYIREGEPISYSWSQSGYYLNWEAEYDMVHVYEDEKITEASVSNITALPLKKNTDYYFSIVCKGSMAGYGCQNLLGATLSDEPAVPDDEEDAGPDDGDAGADAGDGDDGGDDGGCDCRAAGSSATAGVLTSLASLL